MKRKAKPLASSQRQKHQTLKHQTLKRQTLKQVGAIACLLILLCSLPAIAQSPSPAPPTTPTETGLQLLERYFTVSGNNQVAVRPVQLDGYRLFDVASLGLAESLQARDGSFVDSRVQTIESTLNRIANSNFDPDTLEIEATVDQKSNLPVITINKQYLMTVTTLDAQLQATEPEQWADNLVTILRTALLRARQERQREALLQQAGWAIAVLGIVTGVSGAIATAQRHLQGRYQRLKAETPDEPTAQTDAPEGSPRPTTGLIVQQRLTKLQQRNTNDVQRRLLNLLQVGLWLGAVVFVVGLFPYTRWLRSFILATPLKLIAVVLATYVLTRVTDVLVDRFLQAIQENQLLIANVPQRFSLRISTLSRVLKSGLALLWAATGFLTALSLLGVDLLPLVAGAGIIGLALSFAAQSVIKDVINGLLILLEDQYAVGDVVNIGSVGGLVENMNLRITQLRDSEGKLITIPNSEIKTVQNLSKDWSRVDLTVSIAYGTPPSKALSVMKTLSEEMYRDPAWHAELIEPPEILGIEEITHAGILIRIWIKTQPLQQWKVAREFRRRLITAMEEADLTIGIPQQLQFIDATDAEEELRAVLSPRRELHERQEGDRP